MFALGRGMYKELVRKDEFFVVLTGLDNAGKTTFVEQFKANFDKTYTKKHPSKILSTVGLNYRLLEYVGQGSAFDDSLSGELNKAFHLSKMSKAIVGKPAPNFDADAVVGKDFKRLSLTDFRGKYVVLMFYPRDFTFVCPTEIISFSDHYEDFASLNTAVLAVSTDSKYCHLEWTNKPRNTGGLGEVKIPLLADTSHKMSIDYGVLKEDEGVAYRGLFIIDPEGVLRQVTINDLPVGRSVQETIRLVQAFQFVEKHGEVCPADWMPGGDTINLQESLIYFNKHA